MKGVSKSPFSGGFVLILPVNAVCTTAPVLHSLSGFSSFRTHRPVSITSAISFPVAACRVLADKHGNCGTLETVNTRLLSERYFLPV